MEDYMIPCLVKSITGIPCPGCGGQRAVLCLLHGELGEAFLMYPAIYPLLLFGGLLVTHYFIDIKNYSRWISGTAITAIAAILIHYGIELLPYL